MPSQIKSERKDEQPAFITAKLPKERTHKMHHKLDINPIPENVIYINDPCLADTCDYELQDQYEKAVEGKTVSKGGVLPWI